MSYNALALKTDLRFPNEMIRVLRMVDEVVCAPFKNNNDMITDLLLFGMCNAQEGMNPFNKMGALQVSMEQSLSPSYNLGLLWEPTDVFWLRYGLPKLYSQDAYERQIHD